MKLNRTITWINYDWQIKRPEIILFCSAVFENLGWNGLLKVRQLALLTILLNRDGESSERINASKVFK